MAPRNEPKGVLCGQKTCLRQVGFVGLPTCDAKGPPESDKVVMGMASGTIKTDFPQPWMPMDAHGCR